MASKIDIVNMSLAHLGMQGITSITQNIPAAIAANAYYDACRDEVFSDFKWPFATTRVALVEVSDVVLGWDYVYAYPSTAAAVWGVFDESTVNKQEDQEFEVLFIPSSGIKVICANIEDAYSDYTYIVTDPTIYSAKFVTGLSYRLAAAMAHTLVGNADFGIKMMNVYAGFISEAKRTAYAERIKKPTQTSSYQNSRG